MSDKLLIDSELVDRIRTGGTWYVENLENLPPARFLDLDSIEKHRIDDWYMMLEASDEQVLVRYSDLTDRIAPTIGREELVALIENEVQWCLHTDKYGPGAIAPCAAKAILDRLKGVNHG